MRAQKSEEPLSFAEYAEIGLRRRWWIVGTLLLVWGAAWAATWLLPARYRSETTILIEELQVPARGTGEEESELQARLQTLTTQLLSRTRLQRIIQDLKLYGRDGEREVPEGLVGQMRRDIKVQPLQVAGRPNELAAFTVSYSAGSPTLAREVTRRLTSLFIEENIRTRAEQSEQTTRFLDDQLQDARAWLQKQEGRLQEFKARYLGQLPSQAQTNLAVVGALETQLQTARQGAQRAQQQRVYLASLLAQYRELRLAGEPALTPPALEAELSRLRQQIAEQRLRYTEGHPDLMRLREQLAATEKLKTQIGQELATGQASPMMESPTTAQIHSQLQANQQELRDRENEMAGIQAEMRGWRGRLRNMPLREQQLAELTRDYDQSRAYYESLLAKRNQAQLASSLERRQKGEQFRVLDAPSLPAAPYSPNRFKFSMAGLLLGVLAGAAAGYAREQMDDRIYSREAVEAICPGPVLAVIPRSERPQDRLRKRLRIGGEIVGVTVLLALVTGSTLLAFVARYRD